MNDPRPCNVEIRIAADGSIMPLRFTWGGEWFVVAQVGRGWSDDGGDHWLVMPSRDQVFELLRADDDHWQCALHTAHPRFA